MKFNIKNTRAKKAQSILEYLIVLSAIIVVIIINTVGFSTGIKNSLNLQKSLDITQNAIETGIIRDAEPPSDVTSEAYYKPTSEITSNPNKTDLYRGQEYTGGYDYDTWVKNNPNSAYNAPEAGTIVENSN